MDVETYPNSTDSVTQKIQEALKRHREGKLEEAHALYSQLLEEDKGNASVIHLIGLISAEIDNHLDAINLFVLAIDIDKEQSDYYFSLGYSMHEVGWGEQTIQAYQKCIMLRQDYAEAFSNLARVFTEANRYDEAMKCYERAVTLNPKTFAAYIGLAITLKRMGLEKDALEALEIAATLVPSIREKGATLSDVLNYFDREEKPLMYKPRLVAPGHEGEAPAPRAKMRKTKPKIRIIHNLAMSGGALVSRCIGSMEGVGIFNNIHPKSASIPNYGTHIFLQAASWYHLFSDKEKQKLQGTQISFVDAIKMIAERMEHRGETTVIRDWTHLDFTAVPFLEKPTYRLSLAEALQDDFEVLQVATTRHPIDNWLNVHALALLKDKLDLDTFLEGYRKYAEAITQIPFFHYEAFTQNPDDVLAQICEKLEIPFDSAYTERWKFFTKIPLENDESPEIISLPKRAEVSDKLLEEFEANFDYWPALKALKYEHL